MLKKVILAATGLALSAPVFADHGYRDYRYGQRVVYQPVYVVQRPVVVRQVYRPAPVAYPAPYYQASSPGAGAAIFFGAVLGAVVAHQIVTH